MSRTELYIIGATSTPVNEDPEDRGHEGLAGVTGYRNSHGYHMAVWDHVWKHARPGRGRFPLFGDLSELWGLAKDEAVPRHHRIAHASTFDRAIIAPERVQEVAQALEETAAEIEAGGGWSHLREVATAIRTTPLPSDARGFGLDTSLSDVWVGYLSDGKPGYDLFEALEPA